MQKKIRYLSLLLALLCLFQTAQTSAATAPILSRIVPVVLFAEETSGIPAPTEYPNRIAEGVIFRGENLYIKTRFFGYPAWGTLAYRSDTETGRTLSYTELECTPITNSDRIIIGYEQLVMIPFAQLGTAETDLCITADGSQGGSAYAYIRGIRTERT